MTSKIKVIFAIATLILSSMAVAAVELTTQVKGILPIANGGTGNASGVVAAGTLSGNTLAAGVTASSLTSVGTLTNLTVTNPISGSVTGAAASVPASGVTGTLAIANGGTNSTSFTAPAAGVSAIPYFNGTSLVTDPVVGDFGYNPTTNTAMFNSVVTGDGGVSIGTTSSGFISWQTAGGIRLSRTNVGPVNTMVSRWTGTQAFVDLIPDAQWAGVTIGAGASQVHTVNGLLTLNNGLTATAGTTNLGVTSTGPLLVSTGAVANQMRTAQTTAPVCSLNCGTAPAVVGTDTAMVVTMGATGAPASGFVVTFNGTWAAEPSCIAQSDLSSMVVGKMPIAVQTTTTTVTVTTNGTAPANSDKYNIHCIGVQ